MGVMPSHSAHHDALVMESFRRHVQSPAVSAETYLNALKMNLGKELGSRKKLYLDTRYWVFLRDAKLGRAKRSEHDKLLQMLQALVTSGQVVCPVSDAAHMELTKQTDDVTRSATAALCDELSLGVALQSEPDRVHAEITHFLMHPVVEGAPFRLQDACWVRAGLVVGIPKKLNLQLPEQEALAFEKAMIDLLWHVSFEELAQDSSAHLRESSGFESVADRINIDMRKEENKVPSYEKAYLAEIIGSINFHGRTIRKVLSQLYLAQKAPGSPDPSAEQLEQQGELTQRVLVNAFRYRRDMMARRLPAVHLHASCHASVRIDHKRKVNGNFLRDFHHAHAGVGYHDAMFTEKPLRVLLTAGKVKADTLFGCRIMSDEAEVLDYLLTNFDK